MPRSSRFSRWDTRVDDQPCGVFREVADAVTPTQGRGDEDAPKNSRDGGSRRGHYRGDVRRVGANSTDEVLLSPPGVPVRELSNFIEK